MFRSRLRQMEALVNHLWGRRRGQPAPPPRRLQTAQDVVDVLEEQAEALRADTALGTVEKARALACVVGVARKAIETGMLAARLEALEQVLQQRGKEQP